MAAENVIAQIRVCFPDGTEQIVPIVQSPFNIGRVPGSDLQLAHQLVSRNHARLLFQGREIVLIDLNSANGTIVGDKRLGANEPYALGYGERFTIGPYTLQVEPAAEATTAESLPPTEVPAEVMPPAEPPARTRQRGAKAAPPPPPPEPPPPAGPRSGDPAYDQAFGLPADQSRYLRHLPPLYHADPFLGRFLLAFEGIMAPIEQIVDNLDLYLDPRQAPPFFLQTLAGWLGLTLDEKWPLAKQRAILAEAAEIYRRRGTHWALRRHLEIYTGVTPQIEEPEDQPFHFRVVLHMPKGQAVDRATVERIIAMNKPAHTTYTLEITTDA